jgi:hypothetical protein
MLQVFHLDVAKIDLDVAYTCKYFMCFHMYVAIVSSGFLHMFVMATHVFLSFFWCFLQVFETYVASVSPVLDVCYRCFI